MTGTCQCPADGFCPRYQRRMEGRPREICRGENIEPHKAAKYRANWERLAQQSAEHKARHGAPGDELKALLAEWGYSAEGDCNCEAHVLEMNAWGVAGCRENRATIKGWLIAAAQQRGWRAEIAALAGSGWLVDEAIRRAAAKIIPQTDNPSPESACPC